MENQPNQSNALSLPRVSFGKENLSAVRIPPPAPYKQKRLWSRPSDVVLEFSFSKDFSAFEFGDVFKVCFD